MQALLLPARAAPPTPAMLRQRAVSASACASQESLHFAVTILSPNYRL
uniref:Uncharacterized protein n=1 Tax=Zea mays TaxID=4577 RepID=B6U592_MAIZE|nr:hypothetical protein [Zea mays]